MQDVIKEEIFFLTVRGDAFSLEYEALVRDREIDGNGGMVRGEAQ
jgi:hypothetical protein